MPDTSDPAAPVPLAAALPSVGCGDLPAPVAETTKKVRIVRRKKPAEAYLMVDGVYWAGVAKSKCCEYETLVTNLHDEIVEGKILDATHCRVRLNELLTLHYASGLEG